MTKAEQDVLAEREKQRRKWGDRHDDKHSDEALAAAAAALAHPHPRPRIYVRPTAMQLACAAPDWAETLRARHDRRGQLVIAAALALAEIERLDRFDEYEANCSGPG